MSDRTDSYITLVESYGIPADQARIYVYLLKAGVSSALQISRGIKMGRSKVYRLLDKLKESGLVRMLTQETGFHFEATDPTYLQLLVTRKEKEAEVLRQQLPTTVDALLGLVGAREDTGRVKYYEGREGVVQMSYNSLRAKGVLLTFEIGTLDSFMEHEVAEDLRADFLEKEVQIKTITNVNSMKAWTAHTRMVREFWEIRQIPPEEFEIKFEVLLYNQVYALYRYDQEHAFGVEIYDETLSTMQRQLFFYLWERARKFRVLTDTGKAEVVGV